MNVQMMKKEEHCEKLEQEFASLRKNLKNSQVPKHRTYLGCMGETSYKEYANASKNVEEKEISTQLVKRIDEKWIRFPERRNDYKRDEYTRRPPTFRNKKRFNQYEGNYRRLDRDKLRHEPRCTTSQRRSLSSRYQNFFLGHYYTCGNFGHKVINCIINERNKYARNMNGVNSRYGNVHGYDNKNYNPFDPPMDQNILCYK